MAAKPYLLPMMTRQQRVQFAGFAVGLVIANLAFWAWWLQSGHVGNGVSLIIASAPLAIDLVVLPAWSLWWIGRMRRPNPALAVPDLRVAMVVTKAPSEPWPLVRKTLDGMLAQQYPHRYDVWLADEQPSPEVRMWCRDHGVGLSTRSGVRIYHRPVWPRRTRCKEGNLRFFYDFWGYRKYDVVVQLDADHVPTPSYLRHMVAPFADPKVGYVAAPSVCDANAERSWSARGRLWVEALLHGPIQAGSSGGYAPSCIGSHYAVRTAALADIGGLGPELAEDFTTTLMMSSRGWEGAFAIEAEAHGDGPDSVADCMTQEFQWARSMMNVLLTVSRGYWSGLTGKAKLRLGFCQLWYPLSAVLWSASVALPIAALLTRSPLVRIAVGTFYLNLVLPVGVVLALALWLKAQGWLRPHDARILSWEGVLFTFARWPWALIGCLHALAGWIAHRDFEFKVTPKGRDGEPPLPLRVIAPYLAISAICLVAAFLLDRSGSVRGYWYLVLCNGVIYLGVALVIVKLHIAENPSYGCYSLRTNSVAFALTSALVSGVVAGPITGAEALASHAASARYLTSARTTQQFVSTFQRGAKQQLSANFPAAYPGPTQVIEK